MDHWLLFSILRLPIVEVIVMGALTGLVGALALTHKRIFFTEALTHATFPGAILGVVFAAFFVPMIVGNNATHAQLSVALFIGAAIMCLPLIWLMNMLAKIPGQSSQSSAGIILTFGFALGYFFNKWYQPLPLNINTFLTGSVLNIDDADLSAVSLVLICTLVVIGVAGRYLMYYSFDPLGYRAAGYHSTAAETTILLLVAATIVVVIPAVGTILPIALIAAPAAVVYPYARRARTLFIATPILGIVICLSGMAIAVIANLSVGGTIAVLAGLVYVIVAFIRYLWQRISHAHAS